MEKRFAELLTLLGEVKDLEGAAAALSWDQQTYMPPQGAAARAQQLATLKEMAHTKFASDSIGELLGQLKPWAAQLPHDSFEASVVRVAERDYRKAIKVPAQLVSQLSQATAMGLDTWLKAKSASDFAAFMPSLQRIIDLKVQEAEALGYEGSRYDALLDAYEPQMRSGQVNELFEQLKQRLIPLVQAISERLDRVDDSFLHQHYPDRKQWDFGIHVLSDMGFDFRSGRQDRAVHPMTTRLGQGDVRQTTRIQEDFLPSSMFSTFHECGHALYEMGLAEEFTRTPLADGASLGVHESQSRMWENLIGRSFGFWRHYFPRLQRLFPTQLGQISLDAFYRAVNRVEPSLVRIEADEVTYNLHIFIRFELEQQMLSGQLAVQDLPEAWNGKMSSYLGVVPPNDSLGVLQDVHWSVGLVGYFPTYTLGNILSVQFLETAANDYPAALDHLAGENLLAIREWMKEHIHRHGRKFTMPELVQKVTGGPISVEPYLNYIERKYAAIYDL